MNIDEIRDAIRAKCVRITYHAVEKATADRLSLEDVFSSVSKGEIIEKYPTDRPYPSCLIYGRTPKRKPLHSVWAYNEDNQWTVLITVYRPDPDRWIDWRERK